jgi:tetratricopeptide (TPR) repeat protein
MVRSSSLRYFLFSCLIACTVPLFHSQSSGVIKATPPSGVSYSAEGLAARDSASQSVLKQKETDLRAALSQQPNSPPLLFALALVQREENDPHASLDTYTHAAQFRKPTPQELRSVALDYVLLSDYDDAIHWLEVAVDLAPADTEILYALGRCYYSKSRFADAGKMYQRVLAIDPHNLKAEENLGLVYDATNHPVEAESALRMAVSWSDANGKDQWPFLDLGSFLVDHNRSNDAIAPLQIAAQIQPDSAAAHERLGRALLATQQTSVGIAELQQSAKLDEKNPKVHFELGRALRQAGRSEEAKKEFEMSQQLYATHSEE